MPRKKQRTLSQDLADLRRLKATLERKSAEKDEAADRFAEKQAEVYERMEKEDVQSQKTGGNTFVSASTVYGKVQDEEQFIKWAEEQDETLVQTKPRKQLLNELVRARLDEGQPLPPGVGSYTRDYIAIRAAK